MKFTIVNQEDHFVFYVTGELRLDNRVPRRSGLHSLYDQAQKALKRAEDCNQKRVDAYRARIAKWPSSIAANHLSTIDEMKKNVFRIVSIAVEEVDPNDYL